VGGTNVAGGGRLLFGSACLRVTCFLNVLQVTKARPG
jgi:hypothetical protein